MANVLVTGGTGFIGSRVCDALHQKGDTVYVLSRNPDRAQNKLPSSKAVYAWNPETKNCLQKLRQIKCRNSSGW